MLAVLGLLAPLCAAALGLGGCAPEHGGEPPDARGISYRLEEGELAETDRRADAYCQRMGLKPRLRGVTGTAGSRVAIYECV